MHPPVTLFFSRLHIGYLKPLGFRKKGHVFSRPKTEYVEYFRLAGSRWNSSDRPWQFDIEFGVYFPELDHLPRARSFPSTHCWDAVERICTTLRGRYELLLPPPNTLREAIDSQLIDGAARFKNQDSIGDVIIEVVDTIVVISDSVKHDISTIRDTCVQRIHPWSPGKPVDW